MSQYNFTEYEIQFGVEDRIFYQKQMEQYHGQYQIPSIFGMDEYILATWQLNGKKGTPGKNDLSNLLEQLASPHQASLKTYLPLSPNEDMGGAILDLVGKRLNRWVDDFCILGAQQIPSSSLKIVILPPKDRPQNSNGPLHGHVIDLLWNQEQEENRFHEHARKFCVQAVKHYLQLQNTAAPDLSRIPERNRVSPIKTPNYSQRGWTF